MHFDPMNFQCFKRIIPIFVSVCVHVWHRSRSQMVNKLKFKRMLTYLRFLSFESLAFCNDRMFAIHNELCEIQNSQNCYTAYAKSLSNSHAKVVSNFEISNCCHNSRRHSEQIHISVSAQHMINKQMVSHQLFCALSGCCRLYLPSSHYIIRYFNENIHGSIASTSIVHRWFVCTNEE